MRVAALPDAWRSPSPCGTSSAAGCPAVAVVGQCGCSRAARIWYFSSLSVRAMSNNASAAAGLGQSPSRRVAASFKESSDDLAYLNDRLQRRLTRQASQQLQHENLVFLRRTGERFAQPGRDGFAIRQSQGGRAERGLRDLLVRRIARSERPDRSRCRRRSVRPVVPRRRSPPIRTDSSEAVRAWRAMSIALGLRRAAAISRSTTLAFASASPNRARIRVFDFRGLEGL